MSSDSESEARRPNGSIAPDEDLDAPIEPSTPPETGVPDLSQVTLPSTEVPPSPVNEPAGSFRTEVNEDRVATTVIPSSLTPPPSTQVAPVHGQQNGSAPRRSRQLLSHSQESNFVSPPATILNNIRHRDVSSDYAPPSPREVRESSADELRAMLQTCIAEHQKLKMETAHHRLQYNLLSLQASEDSNRAEVELEMLRKEIEALRTAEHSRQARRELNTFSEVMQTKYLDMKAAYEEAVDELDALSRRLKTAKKIIQQKDDEVMGLMDERHQLLNRIRENREHMNKLRSPGGIFHGAVTPKQSSAASPVQNRTPRPAPRGLDRDSESGNKLSTLLEVLSQDNNSAPSTPITAPHRTAGRHTSKHHRNAQSMSSLPTTPISRPRGAHAGLLPSADLVPQTEPPQRYPPRYYEPTGAPASKGRRRSRESTISAEEDNEELARQAFKSFTSLASSQSHSQRHDDSDVFGGSQASQAATEMLRRHPRESFEVIDSSAGSGSRDQGSRDQGPAERTKLFSNLRADTDKRKFSGGVANYGSAAGEGLRPEQGSPQKKTRVGSGSMEQRRLGLGIQYGQ
ncbi:hypothetical protein ACRE_028420 [Hapsidospora chrysogenum ATCC 11550]|uniref:FAD-dependent oxidoreductase-like enzyme n=1 Tax=Hapsidospora chrysogenum (strain ATCC 11550 / CBS 779.69 / DSM 880 / IAM 14645 / JCM 23072 / IMI 49137) TaxID=857340 RepID=A0A086TAH1_HAPC1|nr:hypothetical protein ACRE_028420 [Hapsidospora chrysogenum ATCC 11550]